MNADKGLAWRPLEGVCTVNVGPFLFSLLEIPLMLRQVAEKVHCDNNCFGHGSVSLVQILKLVVCLVVGRELEIAKHCNCLVSDVAESPHLHQMKHLHDIAIMFDRQVLL